MFVMVMVMFAGAAFGSVLVMMIVIVIVMMVMFVCHTFAVLNSAAKVWLLFCNPVAKFLLFTKFTTLALAQFAAEALVDQVVQAVA